jgi:hypothetical protein
MQSGKSLATMGADAPAADGLTERLRAAIRSEAYEEVLALLGDYNRRFEHLVREASGDPQESRRLFSEARDLIGWAKAASLANRAHAEASLGRLTGAARYMPAKGGFPRARRAEA